MTAYENEVATYTAANPKSHALHERASQHMPGGDTRNSIWWHPFPVYIEDAEGSTLTDIDGNKRVDMVNNMTTLILGHKHPAVVQALKDQVDRGVSFPAPSPPVVRWAELLTERVASLDKVRFTNSGTEGTLNAVRAARAFTGRQKIAKCEGAYHGNHDAVQISVGPDLSQAGDALNPNAVADTLGIADSAVEDMIVMPYNDIENCERIIRAHAGELAAVIVEPVNGRSGMIPARPGFLEALRDITRELDIVLIFDEVIAFRISHGGAQEYFGVTPDLTCFGKTIGGGMPVGAFGGREDIMSLWDPGRTGNHVEHAGTFNGNPMTAVAGIATLERLTPDIYADLDRKGESLRSKLGDDRRSGGTYGRHRRRIALRTAVHHRAGVRLPHLQDQRRRDEEGDVPGSPQRGIPHVKRLRRQRLSRPHRRRHRRLRRRCQAGPQPHGLRVDASSLRSCRDDGW